MPETVIRVKRRLNEDPVDALLLSYKRRKTDGAQSTVSDTTAQALLKFAGTVEEKNIEVVKKALNNVKTKAELKESFKSHLPDIARRKRLDSQSRSKESRFKILSCNRAHSIEIENVPEDNSTPITIVDVGVDDEVPAEENMEMVEPKYVYDLYSTDFMPEEVDIDDGYFESLVSVEPFRTQSQYRGSEDSEDFDAYDEDSNDESNWRNDYPDSDNSINEDDMRLAASMHGMGIDNGIDLSSDSEDERYFARTGMSPPRGFDAFKRRILMEEMEEKKVNFIDVVEDEDESDGGSYHLDSPSEEE